MSGIYLPWRRFTAQSLPGLLGAVAEAGAKPDNAWLAAFAGEWPAGFIRFIRVTTAQSQWLISLMMKLEVIGSPCVIVPPSDIIANKAEVLNSRDLSQVW